MIDYQKYVVDNSNAHVVIPRFLLPTFVYKNLVRQPAFSQIQARHDTNRNLKRSKDSLKLIKEMTVMINEILKIGNEKS